MTTPQYLLLGLLGLLLVVAAIGDIRSRIIPNGLNAAIALLAIGWWWAGDYGLGMISLQIGCAFAMLVLFGLCFAGGMMGGGDVKLIVALALWLPLDKMLFMLVIMALAGGFLTVAMVIGHTLRRAAGRPEIPYGVAISGAGLLIVANLILTTPGA